jgi:hypothetical protein
MRFLFGLFVLGMLSTSHAAELIATAPFKMFEITFTQTSQEPSTVDPDVDVPTFFKLRLEKNLLPRVTLDGLTMPGLYEDQILDSGAQGVNFQAETAYGTYSPQGLPRGWTAEYRLMQQRTNDSSGFSFNQSSVGLLINTYLDTPNYGLLSANANLNTSQSATNNQISTDTDNRTQTWRVDQRALPLTANWSANHSAGHIYTPLPSLARGYSRATLTSHPIEGVSGEWLYDKDLIINASAGHMGFFTGKDSQGFAIERGLLSSVGGQIKLSGTLIGEETAHSALALQMLQTNQADTSGSGGLQSSQRALWTSYVWQGIAPWGSANGAESGPLAQRSGGLRIQGNLIQGATATGASMDANWRSERLQHTGSLFYFQPDLRWGTANLASDLRGAAWRGNFASRAWSAGLGAEISNAITTPNRSSNFVNGFGRYRIDNRNAISSNWAVRTGAGQGQSHQFTWDHTSNWGNTQLRTDSLRSADSSANRIGIDQRWPSSTTRSLSTSLALNSGVLSGTQSSSVEWGLLASTAWSRAKLEANLRGTQGQQSAGGKNTNTNANIDLSWPLAPNWSLIGQLNLMQGQSITPLTIVAASTQATTLASNTNTNQTFVIALRYQDRAGTATAPIGGTYGAGAGAIEGVVFLDEDRNKERSTNEKGVAGVTIVLDRRFAIRTDEQGRFKFPAVAAGTHSLELIPDNVPLPWYAATAGAVNVDVRVRDTSVINFPLQKNQ